MQERFPGGGIDLSGLIGSPGSASPNSRAASPARSSVTGSPVEVPALVFDATDQDFEEIASLSQVVPVVLLLHTQRDDSAAPFIDTLSNLIVRADGRLLLARIDIDQNPGFVQALQIQTVPTTLALVTGQPVPLFQGIASEEQVAQILDQVIQLSVQQGLPGRVQVNGERDGKDSDAQEPVTNPAHAAALEAIEQGDYSTAVREYEDVLVKNPRDEEAAAALAQVKLLQRVTGVALDEARSRAAAEPQNIDAQLLVADLDVSGGHIDDAFGRLLDLFVDIDEQNKTLVQERLLELFTVVGATDPRVVKARTKLANLLF